MQRISRLEIGVWQSLTIHDKILKLIFNYPIRSSHSIRLGSGEQYAKRRPEELIGKLKQIQETLNHHNNLQNPLKHLSLLSTLQCLSELKKKTKQNKVMKVNCFHSN